MVPFQQINEAVASAPRPDLNGLSFTAKENGDAYIFQPKVFTRQPRKPGEQGTVVKRQSGAPPDKCNGNFIVDVDEELGQSSIPRRYDRQRQ